MTINISGFDVLIDDEDYERVMDRGPWHRIGTKKSDGPYFAHTLTSENHRIIQLHRFIISAPVGLQVDHININTLDNRKENLRVCTNSENQKNKRDKAHSYIKYKGIFQGPAGTWKAQITVKKRSIDLGVFQIQEEAHAAYCQAAKKYRREYLGGVQ